MFLITITQPDISPVENEYTAAVFLITPTA